MGFIDYLRETRSEMAHVSWPTRRQTAVFTVLIIALSVLTAAFLGVFDFAFTLVLEKLVI